MANIILPLGFGGKISAGKTTAGDFLERITIGTEDMCVVFSTTKFMDHHVESLGLPVTRENKQKEATVLLGKNPNAIIDALHQQIKDYKPPPHIRRFVPMIDSLRAPFENDEWRRRFPGFRTIFIDSTHDLRFERYNKREVENMRPEITQEEFDKKNNAPIESHHDELKIQLPKGLILRNVDIDKGEFRKKVFCMFTKYVHTQG